MIPKKLFIGSILLVVALTVLIGLDEVKKSSYKSGYDDSLENIIKNHACTITDTKTGDVLFRLLTTSTEECQRLAKALYTPVVQQVPVYPAPPLPTYETPKLEVPTFGDIEEQNLQREMLKYYQNLNRP